MKKLLAVFALVVAALIATAAFAETPPSSPCGSTNNGATTIDAHGTTWGCNAQYKQWVVQMRTTVNTGGDQQVYDSKTFNGPVTFGVAPTVPSYARKLIWSTPDITENASGSNTRPLQGGLNGVAGTIASVTCQPLERGDGGGDVYLSLLDVTDGGAGNLLCSMDFDSCDLATNLHGTLGVALETSTACAGTALSASKNYLWRLGVNLDGGATCGLHTPAMPCTTIINPP